MNQIEVFYKTTFKKRKIKKDDIINLANEILQKEKVENAELNIIFVNKSKIKKINKKYRNIKAPTDVISFALEDNKDVYLGGIRMLGDIYISPQIANIQRKKLGHSYKREIIFLSTHGILHLLGYDHQNQKDERKMINKQKEILNGKVF